MGSGFKVTQTLRCTLCRYVKKIHVFVAALSLPDDTVTNIQQKLPLLQHLIIRKSRTVLKDTQYYRVCTKCEESGSTGECSLDYVEMMFMWEE